MHNLVQDMLLLFFFLFCIVTNLYIIMGCLCYKTFAKIVEFDVNGKKIKSKDMYKTICGSNRQPKKRLGWKIIQVWTKHQNPRRPIGCEKFHEDVCLAIWRNWIWKIYEEDQLNWIEFSITSPLSPSYCFDLIFVWANT